jgi:phosphatidylinositol alpha 1,6-mannosyltransferase
MRVALVTESFLPDVNGVANSVVRTAEHLLRRGHDPLVIAPQPSGGGRVDAAYPVMRMPSLPMLGYPDFRLGLPTPTLTGALRAHGTDVVHLASPFVLGPGARRALSVAGGGRRLPRRARRGANAARTGNWRRSMM